MPQQLCVQEISLAHERLQSCAHHFSTLNVKQRLTELIVRGAALPHYADADRIPVNQVMGCTSQVWLTASLQDDGTIAIAADADSSITRGLAAVLVDMFSGLSLKQLDTVQASDLDLLALGPVLQGRSRVNAFRNMFATLQKRARAAAGTLTNFPSLLITADSLEPQGAFAEAQAQYLQPKLEQVERLAAVLEAKRIGVVAHFYMDPEVQGVLTSAAAKWPHIAISGTPLSPC
jgi:quinolinate synthase